MNDNAQKENYLFVRVHYDKRVASLEPLGLEYLMSAVKLEGRNCMIHDEGLYDPFFRFKRLLKKIDDNKITFVGLSVMSNTAWYVLEVIDKLKKVRPHLKIMVGGPEIVMNHRDFFRHNIDFVYYDNGLESFREAVRNDFDTKTLANCTGISYQDNGQWIENECGDPISDYNIKPDRSLFYENRKKYRVLAKGTFSVMKGSFSCPQKCSFCVSRHFNSCQYREREIDKIVDEIIELDNDKIFFIDDDFLLNKDRVIKICNKLIEKNCYKTYMIFARADSVVRCKDIMPLLYKAGFRDMLVGLEAIEDTTLEKYNKNSSVALNKEAVKILRENNMICVGLFVINYDFKHKDFMNINKFIRKEKLIWVLFGILIPFKGTPVHEENKDKLYKYTYKRTDGTKVLMETTNMPKWLLKLEFAFLYYVNYPRIYLAGIRQTFNKKYKNRGVASEDTTN